MFKKIWEWIKSLFQKKSVKPVEPPAVVINPNNRPPSDFTDSEINFDYQKHPFINFLAAPVMHFPKGVADPSIGFVRKLRLTGTDEIPVIVFFDYLSNQDMMVASNFRLYSHKILEEAMALPCRDRLKYLYPDESDLFDGIENVNSPMTLNEIKDKLEKTEFYKNCQLYFRIQDITST